MTGGGRSIGQYFQVQSPQFKDWVVKKIGEPILQESDFTVAPPNAKWGQFQSSTGTIAKDATVFFGGAASALLTTAAVVDDESELKVIWVENMQPGDLLAFESKSLKNFANASTEQRVGLESRDAASIIHAMFKLNTSAPIKWQYESAAGVFSDFPASIGGALNTRDYRVALTPFAGSTYMYQRTIIDPFNRLYVGFQAAGLNGLETRDMRSLALALINDGGAGTATNINLAFTTCHTKSVAAEPMYTMDWCVSRIPAGVNPF